MCCKVLIMNNIIIILISVVFSNFNNNTWIIMFFYYKSQTILYSTWFPCEFVTVELRIYSKAYVYIFYFIFKKTSKDSSKMLQHPKRKPKTRIFICVNAMENLQLVPFVLCVKIYMRVELERLVFDLLRCW